MKMGSCGTTSNHAMPIYRLSLPFGPSSPLLSPFHRSFHTHYLVSSQTLKQWPYTLERCTLPGLLIILSQRAWASWVSCRQRWGSNGSQHLWDSDSVNLGWDLATWYFKNSSVTQIICLIWEPDVVVTETHPPALFTAPLGHLLPQTQATTPRTRQVIQKLFLLRWNLDLRYGMLASLCWLYN